MTGYIKKIVSDRGFGFVIAADGEDWFFHWSKVEGGRDACDQLREDQEIRFEGDWHNEKGPRIEKLTPASAAAPEPTATS